MYGKESEGVMRSTVLIDPKGLLRRVWPKAKSTGHAQEVLEAVLVDGAGRARHLRTSFEDAGRRARYELFERVAAELGADVIATGHTRDDQAETFLLRLLRGAGPRGLAGIHPITRLPAEAPEARRWSLPAEAPEARRWVVRPLLAVGREKLRAYLASHGQAFREDETNRDLGIPRNRIRHELLPLLARAIFRGRLPMCSPARRSSPGRTKIDFNVKQSICSI